MTKLIRTLIIVNGFIFPFVMLIILITAVKDVFRFHNNNPDEGRVNVNNVVIDKNDTLLLQGLEYSEPKLIANSSGYYLEINSKNFKKPKIVLAMEDHVSFEGGSSVFGYSSNLLNIVFLNAELNPIKVLLNKKAYIASNSLTSRNWEEKKDTTIKNFLYLISFSDSNQDGFIDEKDNSDLYLSDLEGNNFIQITKNINVQSYKSIDYGKNVLIQYYNRDNQRDEYKQLKYAVYRIKENKLQYLDKLDNAILQVNKILIEK